MPRTVGIDLGASYSSVAYVDKATGEAKCVPGPYGDTLCPSIGGLDADGSVIVGAPARRRSVSHPDRGIHSLPEISAFILRALKMWAEVFLGETVDQAVMAVPACFDEGQRRATNEAAILAGLEVLRLVNEPVAAALAYGLHERRRGYVAVYDLGGTMFVILVLKLLPRG